MQDLPLVFDYQSTSPCATEVIDAMIPYWSDFWGNPSSRQNRFGLNASAAVNLARENFASCLKINPQRIIFTSGATEANNLALIGCARAHLIKNRSPGHLITLKTEHHSVIDPCRQLVNEGFRLTELTTDSEGIISIESVKDSIQADTFLISIMMANNEIGVIQPLEEIASLCKEHGIIFHSDASQGFGYMPIDIDKLGIHLLSLSSHKIYGPKGVGALILSEHVPITPLQWGGGQENGLRPGTLPVPLIIGFSKASEIANQDINIRNIKIKALRDSLLSGLQEQIPNILINGSMQKRLPNNLNITIKGVQGNQLHRSLRSSLICSSGSACSNGSPSHVLIAIGRTFKEAEASLRLSIGRQTNINEVIQAIDIIARVVETLRR